MSSPRTTTPISTRPSPSSDGTINSNSPALMSVASSPKRGSSPAKEEIKPEKENTILSKDDLIATINDIISNFALQNLYFQTPEEFGAFNGVSHTPFKDYLIKINRCLFVNDVVDHPDEEKKKMFITALIYIDRCIRLTNHTLQITPFNMDCLMSAAIWLATKFWHDHYYYNPYAATVFGISNEKLNTLELLFLKIINFDLSVDNALYCQYMTSLENYWAKLSRLPLGSVASIQKQLCAEVPGLSATVTVPRWLPSFTIDQPVLPDDDRSPTPAVTPNATGNSALAQSTNQAKPKPSSSYSSLTHSTYFGIRVPPKQPSNRDKATVVRDMSAWL